MSLITSGLKKLVYGASKKIKLFYATQNFWTKLKLNQILIRKAIDLASVASRCGKKAVCGSYLSRVSAISRLLSPFETWHKKFKGDGPDKFCFLNI